MRKLVRRVRLRDVLVLRLVPLTMLALAALAAGTSWLMGIRMREEARVRYLAISDEASYLIGTVLDDSVVDLARLARAFTALDSVSGRDPRPSMIADLVDEGRFRAVLAVDPEGRIVYEWPAKGTIGFSMAGNPILAARPGAPYRGTVQISQDGALSLPIAARAGNWTIVGELSLQWLDGFVRALSFGRTGRASLADRDGTLIAFPDPSFVARRVNVSTLPVIRDIEAGARTVTAYQFSGAPRIGAGARLPAWSWYLVVSQSLSEAMAPVYEVLILLSGGFAAIGLLLVLSFRAILRRTLSPLESLVGSARILAAGDYSPHGMARGGFFELDTLTEEFERMTLAISERQRELEASKVEVEASLAEKEVLLREIHHRVKNNLQVMASMISLQRSKIDDARVSGLFRDAEQRIRSMSIVHENLYGSESFDSMDLLDFIGTLLADAGQEGGFSYSLAGDHAALALDKAIPCALAVNELVMNAAKHARRPGYGTRVMVEVRGVPDLISISVDDEGPGLGGTSPLENAKGIGLTIVEALAVQLNGTLSWSDREGGGARFTLQFPHGGPALP